MSTVTLKQPAISNDLASDFPSLQLARTGRIVRLLGRITLIGLVFALFALFFVPWRQTARGTGTVLALNPQERPQPVKSPAKGMISYVKPGLREGSLVNEGELLLRITPFAADGVQILESQIAAVEAKQQLSDMNVTVAKQALDLQEIAAKSELLSLDEGLEAARKKWEQTQSEVAAYQAELDDKRNQKAIAERVITRGLISGEELVKKQKAAEKAQSMLDKANQAVETAFRMLEEKRQQNEAKRQEIEIKIRSAEAKHNDAKQKLEVIKKELFDLKRKKGEFDRNEILAPRSGVIQQWYGLEGSDTIKEGDQLFVIVPQSSDLGVEMKVKGNDMPLIQEGDVVRLQFEGWPAVQFVGWPSVAVGTFGGKVNRVFPTDDGKGNFRVLVSPHKTTESDSDWPDDRYLRQGVRANGWVLLKEVPLGYEIWRQLNGFPPTVADDEPDKSSKDKKESKVKLPKA